MFKGKNVSTHNLMAGANKTHLHYKLYKSGKNWVTVSLFALSLGALMMSQPLSVKADGRDSADVITVNVSGSDKPSPSKSSTTKAPTPVTEPQVTDHPTATENAKPVAIVKPPVADTKRSAESTQTTAGTQLKGDVSAKTDTDTNAIGNRTQSQAVPSSTAPTAGEPTNSTQNSTDGKSAEAIDGPQDEASGLSNQSANPSSSTPKAKTGQKVAAVNHVELKFGEQSDYDDGTSAAKKDLALVTKGATTSTPLIWMPSVQLSDKAMIQSIQNAFMSNDQQPLGFLNKSSEIINAYQDSQGSFQLNTDKDHHYLMDDSDEPMWKGDNYSTTLEGDQYKYGYTDILGSYARGVVAYLNTLKQRLQNPDNMKKLMSSVHYVANEPDPDADAETTGNLISKYTGGQSLYGSNVSLAVEDNSTLFNPDFKGVNPVVKPAVQKTITDLGKLIDVATPFVQSAMIHRKLSDVRVLGLDQPNTGKLLTTSDTDSGDLQNVLEKNTTLAKIAEVTGLKKLAQTSVVQDLYRAVSGDLQNAIAKEVSIGLSSALKELLNPASGANGSRYEKAGIVGYQKDDPMPALENDQTVPTTTFVQAEAYAWGMKVFPSVLNLAAGDALDGHAQETDPKTLIGRAFAGSTIGGTNVTNLLEKSKDASQPSPAGAQQLITKLYQKEYQAIAAAKKAASDHTKMPVIVFTNPGDPDTSIDQTTHLPKNQIQVTNGQLVYGWLTKANQDGQKQAEEAAAKQPEKALMPLGEEQDIKLNSADLSPESLKSKILSDPSVHDKLLAAAQHVAREAYNNKVQTINQMIKSSSKATLPNHVRVTIYPNSDDQIDHADVHLPDGRSGRVTREHPVMSITDADKTSAKLDSNHQLTISNNVGDHYTLDAHGKLLASDRHVIDPSGDQLDFNWQSAGNQKVKVTPGDDKAEAQSLSKTTPKVNFSDPLKTTAMLKPAGQVALTDKNGSAYLFDANGNLQQATKVTMASKTDSKTGATIVSRLVDTQEPKQKSQISKETMVTSKPVNGVTVTFKHNGDLTTPVTSAFITCQGQRTDIKPGQSADKVAGKPTMTVTTDQSWQTVLANDTDKGDRRIRDVVTIDSSGKVTTTHTETRDVQTKPLLGISTIFHFGGSKGQTITGIDVDNHGTKTTLIPLPKGQSTPNLIIKGAPAASATLDDQDKVVVTVKTSHVNTSTKDELTFTPTQAPTDHQTSVTTVLGPDETVIMISKNGDQFDKATIQPLEAESEIVLKTGETHQFTDPVKTLAKVSKAGVTTVSDQMGNVMVIDANGQIGDQTTVSQEKLKSGALLVSTTQTKDNQKSVSSSVTIPFDKVAIIVVHHRGGMNSPVKDIQLKRKQRTITLTPGMVEQNTAPGIIMSAQATPDGSVTLIQTKTTGSTVIKRSMTFAPDGSTGDVKPLQTNQTSPNVNGFSVKIMHPGELTTPVNLVTVVKGEQSYDFKPDGQPHSLSGSPETTVLVEPSGQTTITDRQKSAKQSTVATIVFDANAQLAYKSLTDATVDPKTNVTTAHLDISQNQKEQRMTKVTTPVGPGMIVRSYQFDGQLGKVGKVDVDATGYQTTFKPGDPMKSIDGTPNWRGQLMADGSTQLTQTTTDHNVMTENQVTVTPNGQLTKTTSKLIHVKDQMDDQLDFKQVNGQLDSVKVTPTDAQAKVVTPHQSVKFNDSNQTSVRIDATGTTEITTKRHMDTGEVTTQASYSSSGQLINHSQTKQTEEVNQDKAKVTHIIVDKDGQQTVNITVDTAPVDGVTARIVKDEGKINKITLSNGNGGTGSGSFLPGETGKLGSDQHGWTVKTDPDGTSHLVHEQTVGQTTTTTQLTISPNGQVKNTETKKQQAIDSKTGAQITTTTVTTNGQAVVTSVTKTKPVEGITATIFKTRDQVDKVDLSDGSKQITLTPGQTGQLTSEPDHQPGAWVAKVDQDGTTHLTQQETTGKTTLTKQVTISPNGQSGENLSTQVQTTGLHGDSVVINADNNGVHLVTVTPSDGTAGIQVEPAHTGTLQDHELTTVAVSSDGVTMTDHGGNMVMLSPLGKVMQRKTVTFDSKTGAQTTTTTATKDGQTMVTSVTKTKPIEGITATISKTGDQVNQVSLSAGSKQITLTPGQTGQLTSELGRQPKAWVAKVDQDGTAHLTQQETNGKTVSTKQVTISPNGQSNENLSTQVQTTGLHGDSVVINADNQRIHLVTATPSDGTAGIQVEPAHTGALQGDKPTTVAVSSDGVTMTDHDGNMVQLSPLGKVMQRKAVTVDSKTGAQTTTVTKMVDGHSVTTVAVKCKPVNGITATLQETAGKPTAVELTTSIGKTTLKPSQSSTSVPGVSGWTAALGEKGVTLSQSGITAEGAAERQQDTITPTGQITMNRQIRVRDPQDDQLTFEQRDGHLQTVAVQPAGALTAVTVKDGTSNQPIPSIKATISVNPTGVVLSRPTGDKTQWDADGHQLAKTVVESQTDPKTGLQTKTIATTTGGQTTVETDLTVRPGDGAVVTIKHAGAKPTAPVEGVLVNGQPLTNTMELPHGGQATLHDGVTTIHQGYRDLIISPTGQVTTKLLPQPTIGKFVGHSVRTGRPVGRLSQRVGTGQSTNTRRPMNRPVGITSQKTSSVIGQSTSMRPKAIAKATSQESRYYQKLSGRAVETRHGCYAYRGQRFKLSHRVSYIRRGSVLHVVGVLKRTNGITRLKLANGRYVTGLKHYSVFVKISKRYRIAFNTRLKVQAKRGIYAYRHMKFQRTERMRYLARGTTLRARRLVRQGHATRYELTNGQFVTARRTAIRPLR